MKPVCLFFFANDLEDAGQNLRKLAAEARAIERAMESASELCEFHIQKNTTADDIRRTLAKYRHRVALVHYAGHAESLRLMLETANGGKEGFRNETLAEYLRNQDGIELVFLNGCSTGDQVDALLGAGVPYVISTKTSVGDTDATKLSTSFYEGISFGSTIDEAWREAVAATRQQNESNDREPAANEDAQTRGANFTKKVKSTSKASGFDWSLRSRPGIDPAPKWNLPEASNNPLLGLPRLSDDLGYPEEPFQHLRRFTRDEARVFFGRGTEILSLYNDITSKHSPSVVLYYGQSGVGKSSLLEAGLLPRLEHDYQVLSIRRSANGLIDDLRQAFGILGDASNETNLNENNSNEFSLGSQVLQSWKQKEKVAGKPFVLILDQLEEAWTHGTSQDGNDEFQQLAKCLSEVFRERSLQPKGKVILVFRKEWYPEIDSHLKAQKVARSGVFLKRLSEASVTRAITLNSETRDYYNLVVNQDVAERITVELSADPDSPLAPTLQILLANMWQAAKQASRGEPEFSEELYHRLKSQGVQLSDFLNSQMAHVAKADPLAAEKGMLLSVLRFHCSDMGTASVRTESARREHFGENSQQAEKVIGSCKRHFLIVDSSSDSQSSEGMTRLAHDTLAPVVLKRCHDSNRPAQHASRILALRSQGAEDTEIDLLTRRELRTIKSAQPWMRQFSETEMKLLENSESQIKKANLKRWSLLATAAVVSFVAIWIARTALDSAEVNRRIEIVQNAAPSALVSNAETFMRKPDLTWEAIQTLEAGKRTHTHLFSGLLSLFDWRMRYVPRDEVQIDRAPTNVAILKSLLGRPNTSDLLAQFERANPEDVLSYSEALMNASSEELAPLQKLIAAQVVDRHVSQKELNDIIQMRAKLTWLALLSNRSDLLTKGWFRTQPVSEPGSDNSTRPGKGRPKHLVSHAELRSLLIKALEEWFVDHPRYTDTLQQPLDFQLKAALCQCFFFVSDFQLDDQLRESLSVPLAAAFDDERIAVRSSARAALKRLNLLQQVQAESTKRHGEDWFSIPFETDTGQMSTLDFGQVDLGKGEQIWLATTETPWQLAKRHLSRSRLLDVRDEFVKHHSPNGSSKDALMLLSKPGMPASFIEWSDAIEICNQLTAKVVAQESAAYTQPSVPNSPFIQWTNSTGNGFRLPLAFEWQAMAAAGSKDDYCFGSTFELLRYFAWTQETADGSVHSVAELLPNANGFFDTHGNLQEWCWPAESRNSPTGKTLVAMDSLSESEQVKTSDGSFMLSRNNSKLIQNPFEDGAVLKGRSRQAYMGFRLAISKRPNLTTEGNK